jgi:CRP/FNR family transcriptional regulator, cyclic AMP receptor protein
VVNLLHKDPSFSELFLAHVLSRNIKIEEDLVDQLFNSSEKRPARVLLLLLLLANFGQESAPQAGHSKDQPGNAGWPHRHYRPRVNVFMNKLRKLGFIDDNGGPENPQFIC